MIEAQPGGDVFEIGRIHIWSPPTHLSFGWRQASFDADQDTQVDVRFEAVGDETRVTVEHWGWDSVPVAHVARHGFADGLFLNRHGQWWQSLLFAYKSQLTPLESPHP